VPLRRAIVRFAMRRAARIARALRRGRDGALLVPVTPDGRIVLVRHSYVGGWHLPGGARKRGEDRQAAALREAREEIGMSHFVTVTALDPIEAMVGGRRRMLHAFVARDVAYAPRRSLEIEAVIAVPPDRLPDDLGRLSRLVLGRAGV
jgi:8-oxo-dGTP pyrophosphatase MutT (NUDIX family)